MTLWEYLKTQMQPYADRVAFAGSKITYADLLRLERAPQGKPKLRLCEGNTREDQAYQILRCIAEGNVSVPITNEYGEKHCQAIRQLAQERYADVSDLAFVMFTSGTTGKPKGVMLSHENICTNLEYIRSYFRLDSARKICIARPLVHIAVLVGELLYALCSGLTVYFYEESFMPKRLIAYCAENSIDVLCATPTLYRTLARADKDKRLPVKIAAISGELLDVHSAREIAAAFPNTAFYNVYGLTEHSPRVSALLPQEFDTIEGSVGKPLSGVTTRIENGELLVKSPCVMKGYFDDEEKTRTKLQDGWLHTGDRAHFDKDGYLYIDGRKDGMIIRGGLNVYPEEIEAVARSIVGINDCAVSGQTSDNGTLICLQYEGELEPNELRKFLMQELNPSIVPNKIERVQTLARTPSGKKVRT